MQCITTIIFDVCPFPDSNVQWTESLESSAGRRQRSAYGHIVRDVLQAAVSILNGLINCALARARVALERRRRWRRRPKLAAFEGYQTKRAPGETDREAHKVYKNVRHTIMSSQS